MKQPPCTRRGLAGRGILPTSETLWPAATGRARMGTLRLNARMRVRHNDASTEVVVEEVVVLVAVAVAGRG